MTVSIGASIATPIRAQAGLHLAVPKATGTPGDTLVAWGLAIFASEALLDERVRLSDAGDFYSIQLSVSPERAQERIASFTWQERLKRSRLYGLVSKEQKVTDAAIPQISWDALREAHSLLRASRKAMLTPGGGEGPAITTGDNPQLYPLYQAITNPGSQWKGYNPFVERLYTYLTPDGVRHIREWYDISRLARTGQTEPAQPAKKRARKGAKTLYLNPPGFLYPGMNKGPTMRLCEVHGGIVGEAAGRPDWMMADRRDRPLFEVYLAYVGYFNVARIVTVDKQRVVAVPIPVDVQVMRILSWLPSLRGMEQTNVTEYLAASTALDYAQTALDYQADLQADQGVGLGKRGVAISGAHLSVFWQPNDFTFAPSRITQVVIPVWLPALSAEDPDLAAEVLKQHQKRLRAQHLPPNRGSSKAQEQKAEKGKAGKKGKKSKGIALEPEQRRAIEAYLMSLDGGLLEWFRAVATWFPAARAASRNGRNVGLWRIEEVRRIATVMSKSANEQSMLQVIEHPAFQRLANAIRRSTVAPHYNRLQRTEAERQHMPLPPKYPYRVDYDLAEELLAAAERSPEEFREAFHRFACRYNNETARPSKNQMASSEASTGVGASASGSAVYRPRPLLREEDLMQLDRWLEDEGLREAVPFALLAYGTSKADKRDPATEAVSAILGDSGE